MVQSGEPQGEESAERGVSVRLQAELAALVAHTADGIIGTTLQGIITSWNLAAQRMYGWNAEEAIGQHISVMAPTGLEDIEQLLAQVAKGEWVNHHEARRKREDGSELIASLSLAPVKSTCGEIIGAVVVARDVTARRLAQAGIERRDAHLNELIDTTQDAVIFIDKTASIVRFNASAQHMFGYSEQEVLGQNVATLMPEPYAGEHPGYIDRYERTGEPRAIGRIRSVAARRKNGEVFPIELSVTALGGSDISYAAFIRDISDKVHMQEKLLERERLAAVGATASVFAHEVGNPLNNMYLYAQLLRRRLDKLDGSDEMRADFDAIMEEVSRLHRLLDDFRAFYRSDRLDMVPTDLCALLTSVCHVHKQAMHRALTIECELPDALPEIVGNGDRLKQAFVNLCKNAIEAMPDGGTLSVRAAQTEQGIVIEIEDNGTGIDPELDIFQPFRTTKARGTGLGLPVVRQIITAHGGTIDFKSKLGEGTTFTLLLPLKGPDAEFAISPPPLSV